MHTADSSTLSAQRIAESIHEIEARRFEDERLVPAARILPSDAHTFDAKLVHPKTDKLLVCEVAYRMADQGAMMRPNEDVRPKLISVFDPYGVNILPSLDDETIHYLELEAEDQFEAEHEQ